jgi:sulfocyanin
MVISLSMRAISTYIIVAIIIIIVVVAAVGGYIALTAGKHSSTTITPNTTTTKPPTTSNTTTTNTTSTLPGRPLPFSKSTDTVQIVLVAQSIQNPFNLNGTSDGSMIIYVPVGSNLNITFINQQSLPHNLNLVLNNTVSPNNADIGQNGKILFQLGANMSNYQYNGLMSGQSANGVYSSIQQGYYWLCCGIDTHAESGMWVVVVASLSVSTPYVVVK